MPKDLEPIFKLSTVLYLLVICATIVASSYGMIAHAETKQKEYVKEQVNQAQQLVEQKIETVQDDVTDLKQVLKDVKLEQRVHRDLLTEIKILLKKQLSEE